MSEKPIRLLLSGIQRPERKSGGGCWQCEIPLTCPSLPILSDLLQHPCAIGSSLFEPLERLDQKRGSNHRIDGVSDQLGRDVRISPRLDFAPRRRSLLARVRRTPRASDPSPEADYVASSD